MKDTAITPVTAQDISFYSSEFLKKVEDFKKDWTKSYKKISKEKTPEIDGAGNKIIRKRPDGYDYIIEAYMRECLDKHFPGWSWEMAAPLHFLGSEWVVAQGHLIIVDEHLLAFDIRPPIRKYYGVDSVRIQFGAGKPHTPENIIDVGDNCKSANSAAMKVAINRLCHIGDDVYGKRIEEQGMGTLETIILESSSPNSAKTAFNMYVAQNKKRWSEVFSILNVKDFSEITDYKEAYNKVKKWVEKED